MQSSYSSPFVGPQPPIKPFTMWVVGYKLQIALGRSWLQVPTDSTYLGVLSTETKLTVILTKPSFACPQGIC